MRSTWRGWAAALAAIALTAGCAKEPAALAQSPADARSETAAFFQARAGMAATTRGWLRTVDEAVPNVKFQTPEGKQMTVSDYTVVGRFVSVAKGKGWRVEGDDAPDGILTSYDDSRAAWRSVHAVFEVDRAIGGPAPDARRLTLYLPSPKPDGLASMTTALTSLGQVVAFVHKGSPLTTYDSSLYSVLDRGGPMIAAVGSDGALDFPFMRKEALVDFFGPIRTLGDLETAARVPRVVLLKAARPTGERDRVDGK